MAATSASGFSYRDDQLRKYEFPTEPIPRVSVSDPKADDYISSGVSFCVWPFQQSDKQIFTPLGGPEFVTRVSLESRFSEETRVSLAPKFRKK